jgi:penicillin amidase
MRILVFAASLAATFGLVYFLNNPFTYKGNALPPLGQYFNPFSGFWQNGGPILPLNKNFAFPNLKGDVKVQYDDRQVPHITAEHLEDALFVQGFLHAQNRLWEMDFISHVSAGRLCEMLGEKRISPTLTTLDLDKQARRRGILQGAEKLVKNWQTDKDNYPLLEHYAAGVNAYIEQLQPKDYPIEYKTLGLKPETWSPLKTALVSKYLSVDLALNDNDFAATNALKTFGTDFDAMYPTDFKEQSPVVPAGTKWNFSAQTSAPKPTNNYGDATSMSDKGQRTKDTGNKNADLSALINIPREDMMSSDPSNGSNNWVVAGSKTKNGKPILCGDPHLSLRLPSVWYEQQITAQDINIYGVTMPGIPLVLIGFNNNVAWTMTNVGHDVADWYSITWADNAKTNYKLDGKTVKASLRTETYKIKGKADVLDTVRTTVWGPVVYPADTTGRKDLAFHWIANELPEIDLHFLRQLNGAKNYDDYKKALSYMNVPAQNIAFACTNGDIALIANGAYPIKAKGQGRFVLDGSVSANAWKGFIPRDQIPQYKNPVRGFVSSANQQSTDNTYPYYYNSEGFELYRGRIINDTLAKMKDITVDDMKKLQNCNYSLNAKELLPLLLKNTDTTSLNAAEKAIFNSLTGWNYFFEGDKTEPVYFDEWQNQFQKQTWDEVYANKNVDLLLKPNSRSATVLLRDEPTSIFFDIVATKDKIETGKDIVTASFHTMAAEIIKKQAEVKSKYPTNPTFTWSHVKDTEIPHISNIPGWGREHIDVGGQAKSINAIKKSHGPSWRMIVEMDSVPHAYVVYPGGQSGNPGSKGFDQFVEAWRKGEYYEAVFLKNASDTNSKLISTQLFSKK